MSSKINKNGPFKFHGFSPWLGIKKTFDVKKASPLAAFAKSLLRPQPQPRPFFVVPRVTPTSEPERRRQIETAARNYIKKELSRAFGRNIRL